jgi:AraC-like DNA-binding protein/quercetin dioxygenase-like cupin family protein
LNIAPKTSTIPPMKAAPQLRAETFFRDHDAEVALLRQPVHANTPVHYHDFVELVVVLSGQALHVTGPLRHRLQGGDVLVIGSDRTHAYEEVCNLNLVNVFMRESFLREAERELGSLPGYHALFTLEPVRWRQGEFGSRLRLDPTDLRQVNGWLDAMEEETLRPAEGGRLLAKSYLMLIVGLLARRYGHGASESPHLEMRLGRVLSWIEQNLARPVNVAELAIMAAMSERTFLRRFREATGASPIDYVIRARIRQAVSLLRDRSSRLTITEIAFRCGFDDSNYFTRQFRKTTGASPRSYRSRGR